MYAHNEIKKEAGNAESVGKKKKKKSERKHLTLEVRRRDSQVELVMSYHFGLMNWEVNRVR